ncbi:MAG: alpha-2-macroglobulin family protein [Armatimonadota bacterium]
MSPRFLSLLLCLGTLFSGQSLLAQTARPSRAKEKPKPAASARKKADAAKKPAAAAKSPAAKKPAAAKPTAAKPAEKPAASAEKSKPAAAPVEESLLAQADRAYAEKRWADALRLYSSAQAKKQVPAERVAQVDYTMARCVGLTEQWDRATNHALVIAERYKNTIWDARSRAWLMQLYLMVPHGGWKVGGRYFRGEDVPQVDSPERPERIDLTAEDQRKAVQFGEEAYLLYDRLRAQIPEAAPEQADHAADLVRVLTGTQLDAWARERKWPAPDHASWKLDPDAKYSADWGLPRKALQLYLAVEKIGTETQKPRARLAQAIWLRDYHEKVQRLMRWELVGYGDRPEVKLPPYPYQSRNPDDLLRSVVKDFPEKPEPQRARLLLGDWLAADGKYTEAAASYEALVKEHPQGAWTPAAQQAIAAITRLHLEIAAPAPQLPGVKPKMTVRARNLKSVQLTGYRVKLEEMVKQPAVLLKTESGLEDLLQRIGREKGARKFAQGEPVTWEAPLTDSDDHSAVTRQIEAPFTSNGAYVIEADGGKVHSAVLLLITDLAVVQVVDGQRAYARVVNAVTGAPVAEASAIIRELYDDKAGKSKISAATIATDENGFADKQLSPEGVSSDSVVTFAWKGDRYAVTGSNWASRQADAGDSGQVYLYTERPVYRPGQTVHYRALLATRDEQRAWKSMTDQKVRVRLQAPDESYLATKDLSTGAFGTLHGSFELSPGALLGEYTVLAAWGRGEDRERIAGTFRVEEYKKPEFEVQVTPKVGAAPVRIGERVSATIAARYYFGEPVANGRVQYRVFRHEWQPSTRFTYPVREWAREEIAQGTAATNARGEASIEFVALPYPGEKDAHARFEVVAEVTDASRRTIEAKGEVRALASLVQGEIRLARSFFSSGDRVAAELRTSVPGGDAVAASGTLRVMRLTGDADSESGYREAESHRQSVRTDAGGTARLDWTPRRGGLYEIVFEALDGREGKSITRERVWIAGDAAADGLKVDEELVVLAEQATYRPGDTARLLVVSRRPDLHLMLSEEADHRLLSRRSVTTRGNFSVLEVPVTGAHLPGVTLGLYGVRDGVFLQDLANLQVVGSSRDLRVEVTAATARVQPGEKTTLRIRTLDARGRGVRAEASVGVIDESLTYIQPEELGTLAAFLKDAYSGSYVRSETSAEQTFGSLDADSQPPLKSERDDDSLAAGLGKLGAGDAVDVLGVWTPRRHRSELGRLAREVNIGAVAAEVSATAQPELGGRVESTIARKPRLLADSLRVRSDFQDTALWLPSVVTDENGEATVEVVWPDNLTRWRATAVGWTPDARGGEGSASVETYKDFLVRLQSPRFFVERDEVTLSANVHNYTEETRRVRVSLQLEGGTLAPAGAAAPGPPQPQPVFVPRADLLVPGDAAAPPPVSAAAGVLEQWVEVPQGGEARVDWRVRVDRSGEAKVRVRAEAGEQGDAMEMRFPVKVHGVEKTVVRSGALSGGSKTKPDASVRLPFTLPAERSPEGGSLVVQLNPSVMSTALEALPYLVEYPYGCVEQTLSRFVPCVVAAKTLSELKIDLAALRSRARPEQLRGREPVFDPSRLQSVSAEGLSRLQRFQNADGGWGWWQHDPSDPHMSAYVLEGLAMAKQAGVELTPGLLERGFAYLEKSLGGIESLHEQAYAGCVLTLDPKRAAAAGKRLAEGVYPKREALNAYGLALLAMGLQRTGRAAEAKVCAAMLSNTAKVDRANSTCSWTRTVGEAWEWQNHDVETTATCLRALLRVDPKSSLAAMAARWLIVNRQGNAWDTTRASALAIEALSEFARIRGELKPSFTAAIRVNGGPEKRFTLTPEEALLGDYRLVVPAAELGSGPCEVTVSRTGAGTLYYTAALQYFSFEEDIQPAGNEISVRRRYFRLTRTPSGVEKGEKTADGYHRVLLAPGAPLDSGDLLEVELVLESKNRFTHLVFEDMKPAGCEPVELRSGARYGEGLCSNVELRDDRVAFFITELPQGTRMLTYRLRAEAPGSFHALPLSGYAMYAPLVRCISDEGRITIAERVGASR